MQYACCNTARQIKIHILIRQTTCSIVLFTTKYTLPPPPEYRSEKSGKDYACLIRKAFQIGSGGKGLGWGVMTDEKGGGRVSREIFEGVRVKCSVPG